MLEILIVIAKHKLFLFKCLLVGILMAVLIAVFLPKKYEAATRIMPPQQSQSIATAHHETDIYVTADVIGVALRDAQQRE